MTQDTADATLWVNSIADVDVGATDAGMGHSDNSIGTALNSRFGSFHKFDITDGDPGESFHVSQLELGGFFFQKES